MTAKSLVYILVVAALLFLASGPVGADSPALASHGSSSLVQRHFPGLRLPGRPAERASTQTPQQPSARDEAEMMWPAAAEDFAVLALAANSLSFTILPFDTEPPVGLLAGTVEGSTDTYQLKLEMLDREQIVLLPAEEALRERPDAPIPMEWTLRWKGSGDWTSWEAGESLGPASLDWAIGGEGANRYEFELRCQLNPQLWQLGGNYSGSVAITAHPVQKLDELLPARLGSSGVP